MVRSVGRLCGDSVVVGGGIFSGDCYVCCWWKRCLCVVMTSGVRGIELRSRLDAHVFSRGVRALVSNSFQQLQNAPGHAGRILRCPLWASHPISILPNLPSLWMSESFYIQSGSQKRSKAGIGVNTPHLLQTLSCWEERKSLD